MGIVQETRYGLIGTFKLPPIALLRAPHDDGDLIVGFPDFGPNKYSINMSNMRKKYSHSEEFPNISFRLANTDESISAMVQKQREVEENEELISRFNQPPQHYIVNITLYKQVLLIEHKKEFLQILSILTKKC